MRRKITLIRIFSVCLSVLLLFGCSMDISKLKNVTIEVQMFSGPEYEAMLPTADHWNVNYAEKTGISVDVTALNRIGYFDKLETQLLGGLSTPDIVQPFSLHLEKLKPYLEPLNPYLDNDQMMVSPEGEQYSLNNFLETALNTVTSADGQLYMLPKDMSEIVLFYRKDLISTPPSTWQEYMDVARKFTRSINPDSPTEYGTMMQGKYEIWSFCGLLELIWSYGGSMFVDKTNVPNFNNEATIKSFKIYQDLSSEGVLPPGAIDAEHPELGEAIRSGKIAMLMGWNALYPEIIMSKDNGGQKYKNFSLAPPPGVRQSDGTIKREMYVQTICLGINKQSEKKKQSIQFLLWATLGEGARIYAKHGGSSPVKSVWQAQDVEMPYKSINPWLTPYGRSVPVHGYITDIMMIGANWLQQVMVGNVTSKEAAEKFNEEVIVFLKEKSIEDEI